MDKRRLVFFIAMILLITGALIRLFAPGGFLNSGDSGSATWITIGHILFGAGAITGLVGFAMKSPPRSD